VAAKLIALEDARALVLEHAVPLGHETVPLAAALGRVLAEPVSAPYDVPGFDNSSMDGFALRAADSGAGARLRIAGESRAGAPSREPLAAGEACAISTGAAIPPGADAVVRVEDTRRDGAEVELAVAVEVGASVRHAGDDMRRGAHVLEPGLRLGPAELGVLAALGCAEVSVGMRPRVAVLTTGDEIVAGGAPLGFGEVHNSGSVVIPALVERAGGETISLAHAPDDPAAVSAALREALEVGDVVVVCGGMSVGEHDHVKRALDELGVERQFAGVALKPGRPTLFGTRGATLVFGLPGNPVSTLVTFLLFARPALLVAAGEQPQARRAVAKLAEDVEEEPGRVQAVRCRLQLGGDGWWATTTGPQASHVLTSMLAAEAFAMIPAGEGTLSAGTEVAIELL
jgi:molybdopterin molybdotransferase